MDTVDDFKARHIDYQAQVEKLNNNNISANSKLLNDIRKFSMEITVFLEKQKTLSNLQKKELTSYRDRWIKMVFDDFRRRHIQYQAKAESLGNKVGRNLALLKDIRQFIKDIVDFLPKSEEMFSSTQLVELKLYRDRWIELTASYR